MVFSKFIQIFMFKDQNLAEYRTNLEEILNKNYPVGFAFSNIASPSPAPSPVSSSAASPAHSPAPFPSPTPATFSFPSTTPIQEVSQIQ